MNNPAAGGQSCLPLLPRPSRQRSTTAGRGHPTDLAAREACLRALIEDLAKADNGEVQLVIEQDETLEYRHRRANEEPLLALPDVAAWCWARSGDWRRRIKPILTAARSIEP